jgi:hypothetical protein
VGEQVFLCGIRGHHVTSHAENDDACAAEVNAAQFFEYKRCAE